MGKKRTSVSDLSSDVDSNESRALLFETWLKLEKRRLAKLEKIVGTLDNVSNRATATGELTLDDAKVLRDEIAILISEQKKFIEDELGPRQPKKTKVRKNLGIVDGEEEYEERLDYIFPDDKPREQNFKILEVAAAWKKKKLVLQGM